MPRLRLATPISFFLPRQKKIIELTDLSQADAELSEPKQNAKMVIRRLDRNSEPQASIEAGQYTLQCVSSSVLPYAAEIISSPKMD